MPEAVVETGAEAVPAVEPDQGASSAGQAFDPARGYRCSPSVALRPEPFGALVYHFGTRKLSFLKTPELVEVVSGLERHPDVHAAIEAAGVAAAQRPAYLRALAGLAQAGTIEPRTDNSEAEAR
jgi:putative mycofactocin binding protein MftB